MPLGDVTYQNAALDAVVASWPSSGAEYRLYFSDPSVETTPADVELAPDGGYAGATFSPSDWSAAADGTTATSPAITFGTSTGAYSDAASYWAIVDSTGLIVYSDQLDEAITVLEAGSAVDFIPTLSFVDGA